MIGIELNRTDAMDVFKIAVKLFAAENSLSHNEWVPLFHGWIQNQSVADHLLIDVADYAHVREGPGTVLVSAEANFYMDRADDRLGLTYSRKHPLPGSFRDRLRGAVAEGLKAAVRLEREPSLEGKLKFTTSEIAITLNDRLLAPNTEQTLSAVEGDIRAVADQLFGGKPFQLEPRLGPHTLFEVRLKSNSTDSISALAERLKAAPAVP